MAERKDAPSSVLTGRETSTAIQASTDRLNTQKSPSSERDKNPVDVPALNVKSTEKSAAISEESAEDVDKEKEDRSRDSNKRKRYNAVEFKARYKSQRVVIETADGNAESLYQHLKPTVSELCNILKFSVVRRVLDWVIGHDGLWLKHTSLVKFVSLVLSMSAFEVVVFGLYSQIGHMDLCLSCKEHTSTLQALMISVCWICSSLSKHTVDRKKSFAVATEHLNFSCTEEEADQIVHQDRRTKIGHTAVPITPQEQKRENHGSPNKEALQSSRQILEEDIARKERNEIDKFDREWNEKKMSIVNEFELEKTLIRYLYIRNSSVRLEKLKLVEKEFADELNKHEKLRPVVVNDEISLNRPANETQILDLVESEKEDQESREVAPALLGNPIEAESRDKRVHDLSPVVVPDVVVNLGETSNDVVSGSHTALSEPIGDIPAKHVADMGNDVAGADASVLSEPIGDIPAIEDIASEQQDDVAKVVVSGDDAMVSSASNKNGSNDTSLHADSDQMGIPAANDLTLHIEYVDGSHAVEDPTGTGPHHGAPNVESAELAIPAGNCNQDKAQDTTPSVQQVASPVSDHSMPAIPRMGFKIKKGKLILLHGLNTLQKINHINLFDEPSSVISTDPTITENQAAMSSTSEVLVQTTAPPITAQAQIQLGQYLFDLQRNANSNQAASLRTGGVDPLHIELLQLSSV
ncbi:P-loop containing nucleoside triphosphate hydrolase [Tanacetum coccineum]